MMYFIIIQTAWETCQSIDEGCLLDTSDPSNTTAITSPAVCKQGSLPRYYVSLSVHDNWVTCSNAFCR